jgi:hypothetical protein
MRVLVAAVVALMLVGICSADVPRLMNYQGVLTDAEGVAVDGYHDLTFRIYGSGDVSGEVLWEEVHGSVEVRNGVFSVVLGGLVPMPEGLFSGGERWLSVSVGSDPELLPRTRITPVPWAIRAGVADVALRVEEASLGEDVLIKTDLRTPGQINDPENPVDWTRLKGVPPWLVDEGSLPPEMILGKKDPAKHDDKCKKYGDNHSLDAVDCDPMDVVYVNEAGAVGIGTPDPTGKTEVVEGSMSSRFCYEYESYPGVDDYCGVRGAYGDGTVGYLGVVQKDSQANGDRCYGVRGIAIGSSLENIGVYGIAYGGMLGNTAGLFVGDVMVRQGNLAMIADAGKLNFINTWDEVAGSIEYHGQGHAGGDGLHFTTGMSDAPRMTLNNDGFLCVRNEGEDAGIRICSGDRVRHHIYNDTFMESRLRIAPDGSFHSGGITVLQNGFVGIGHRLPFRQLTVDGAAFISGSVGIGVGSPSEKLDVAGTVKCTVLMITGGGDIAEPFDVGSSEMLKAGMLVVIDSEHPGKLKLSETAYDRCVAGVVSGAGSVEPGMIMSQSGTIADGEFPVALSGRVFCWGDASAGAIQPGDLLTTSDTPGHAMKASDPQRSHGAVIGKAMTSLEEGKGLVLVLVNLQ